MVGENRCRKSQYRPSSQKKTRVNINKFNSCIFILSLNPGAQVWKDSLDKHHFFSTCLFDVTAHHVTKKSVSKN